MNTDRDRAQNGAGQAPASAPEGTPGNPLPVRPPQAADRRKNPVPIPLGSRRRAAAPTNAPPGDGAPRRRNLTMLIGLVAGAAMMFGFLLASFLFVLLPRFQAKSTAKDAVTGVDAGPEGADDGGTGEAAPLEVDGLVVAPEGTDPTRLRVRWLDAEGNVLGEVAPDADGAFRFAPSDAWSGTLLVSCPGAPSLVRRAVPFSGGFELAVGAGGVLVVRVTDDTGAPVAGALVVPDLQEPLWTEGERRAVARADGALTGPDGTARLFVPAEGTVEVIVEAPGHVSGRSDPVVLPAAEPVDLELPRGGRLTGEVVDATDAPVPRATVRVVGSGLWPAREFPADPLGRIDTGMVPPGFYEAEAFEGARVSSLRRGVEVRPGEMTSVRLVLDPGGFLAGRLVAQTGVRADDAVSIVTVQGLQSRLVPLRATASADGSFRVGPLQPGRYLVRCSQSPFLPAEAWAEVVAGGTADVTLVLRAGRTLEARVVGPDGGPVAAARLSLSGRAEEGTFVFRSPTTEALAALDRRGLAPVGRLLPIGELGVLEGPLPPIPPRPFAWLEGEGGDGDVLRSSSLVVRSDQMPGAGASSGPPEPRPADEERRTKDEERAPPLTTDPGGSVSLDGLPPGRYTVRVAHADFAPLAQEVVVPEEPATTSVVLQLTEGCTLTGTVRDGDGNPVAGAGVRILSGLMDPLVWQTDEAGGFTARHLPPHVVLYVQAAGHLTADLEQDLAGTPCVSTVEIGLVRLGGRIAGRVIDGRRFPIRGARVRAEPASGTVRWAAQGATTAADGTFRLATPTTGEVRLVASHPDYVDATVIAEAGEQVDVVLEPGAVVRGSVVDEVGEPLAATVVLRRDGREVATAVAGPDGKFRAGRVAAGDYELRATANGFADQTLVIGIAAPAEGEVGVERAVEIAMRRGVTLAGRVVDRFGEPVGGASIELRASRSGRPPRLARADADGTFAVTGLEPGRWELAATRDDLGTATAEATLDVGTRSRPVEVAFRNAVPSGRGPDAGTAAESPSGRVAYSVLNEQVLVRTPAVSAIPGSDALLAGDTIFQVERERIRDVETLRGILGRVHRATLSVAVVRDGRRRFLDVDRAALLADGWE